MNHAVEAIRLFKSLNRIQRHTFVACFLGWALDAFDFFLLTFVIVPMAHDFGTSIADLSYAITLTLAMRPVGAFIFGLLGDRFGRRMPLMIDIVFYSLMELLTAFSPNYTWLLIFRALYGIGMGGEWGLGASLAMETLPTAARGLFSGILQQGYMFGYLFAALIYGVVYAVGAICGGMLVGHLSQKFGRRRLIIVTVICSIISIPAWVFSPGLWMLVAGGFLMQFTVQGVWGIVPVHLNELSPGEVRGTFPGFAYQLGNLFAANTAVVEARLAEHFRDTTGHPDYAKALALFTLGTALALIIIAAIGPEQRGKEF